MRRQEAAYYAKIARKYPQYWGGVLSMELLDRTRLFLEDRGISRTKALQAIAKHTGLANYSCEMMESKIEYLSALGMSDEKINDVILRSPNILGVSFGKLRQFEQWFIGHGVPEEKIPYVINVFPSGTSNSIEDNLEPKVDFLKRRGCSDGQIARILSMAPQILALGVERMQVNIDFLLEIGISEQELPEYLTRCPSVLALRIERIQATMDAIEELFGPDTALSVLKPHFRILMYNISNMRRSFKYLVSLGFTPERLRENTQYIIRNVNSKLRPRAKFLRAKGADILNQTDWIMMPEHTFRAKHPGYEEFSQRFKERLQQKKENSSS